MFRKLSFILFIILAFSIILLSLLPKPPDIYPEFSSADKIKHGMAYFFMCLPLGGVLKTESRSRRRVLLYVFFFVFIMGLSLEALQILTGRVFDLMDLAANLTGALPGAYWGALAGDRFTA